MDVGRERIVFVIFAGVGILLAFAESLVPAAFGVIGLLIAAVALLCATLAFAMKDYSYLIDPVLHMKGRTIVIDANEPFYMSANGKAIVIRSGAAIHATAFIKIPIYKSATEMSEEEKFNFATVFSRAISISTTPMRISSQLNLVNKYEYLKLITDRLNEVEDRYNTLLANRDADTQAVDRVKGEVNMWHNLLDSVANANSQSQIAFATISTSGGTEDEAVNLVSISAEEIAAGLSATLGVQATIATGDEMLLFIEPDYLIPTSAVQTLSEAAPAETNAVK